MNIQVEDIVYIYVGLLYSAIKFENDADYEQDGTNLIMIQNKTTYPRVRVVAVAKNPLWQLFSC